MKQRGFGLIAAMFILVIVASAAAMMLNITGVQDRTSLLSIQSARAYYAADTGMEWALRFLSSSPTSCALAGGTVNTLNLTEGSLNGFTVTVSCTRTRYDESGTTIQMLKIDSEAKFGAYTDPDYVRRKVSASVPF